MATEENVTKENMSATKENIVIHYFRHFFSVEHVSI